jgi:UDP-3-O-[3-hydroxymyristoyl] glucosamine N-acyltransferase
MSGELVPYYKQSLTLTLGWTIALAYYGYIMYSSNDLISEFAEMVISSRGPHTQFDHAASYESANRSSLVFLQAAEHLPESVAVIVTTKEVASSLGEDLDTHIICVANLRLAQAKIKQHYDDYRAADAEWNTVHDSAVVHKSATLESGCRIGPNAVIGANCKIGKRAIVRACSVIEHGCVIGEDTIINANVNIGYNSQIGDRVIVQAGAIIGSEGYGFVADSDNHYHRIPHTGNVLIEDDVQVGANSCIDRGTYGSTHIARGVKIDNLVHLAHNVSVGEDTLLTAQTVIAGSSKIGKRVIASGQTGVLDHKTVPDDTVLVQRAGVSESLPHGGMWAGSPAKPFKEWVRSQGLGRKVAKLEEQLKQLKNSIKQN